ncbi:hypothetical protein JB92DRAFT_2833793 [Gautieria morchelliformis]|nr:hypothetical protein JB92DRAFT_2833793 [Gautieria morchelliformis]
MLTPLPYDTRCSRIDIGKTRSARREQTATPPAVQERHWTTHPLTYTVTLSFVVLAHFGGRALTKPDHLTRHERTEERNYLISGMGRQTLPRGLGRRGKDPSSVQSPMQDTGSRESHGERGKARGYPR